ncbi:5057_t:CDS:2 [Paraglomus occultum]|uniref:5057_t:CDS:1 n=1 Tax=Paraglomus occultum TaxID=144539 RepID=A0A9N8WC23_9GLOM|nr:5057_t:CDS:2 [Paraglomus occultum]
MPSAKQLFYPILDILLSIARSDVHVAPLATVGGHGTSTADLLVFLVSAEIFLIAGLGGERSFVEKIWDKTDSVAGYRAEPILQLVSLNGRGNVSSK